ncbi:hypothetical protein NL676_016149 [Syzygium grande]|nr:hypothetical protein NL676_016149 [Syzygium grande]
MTRRRLGVSRRGGAIGDAGRSRRMRMGSGRWAARQAWVRGLSHSRARLCRPGHDLCVGHVEQAWARHELWHDVSLVDGRAGGLADRGRVSGQTACQPVGQLWASSGSIIARREAAGWVVVQCIRLMPDVGGGKSRGQGSVTIGEQTGWQSGA